MTKTIQAINQKLQKINDDLYNLDQKQDDIITNKFTNIISDAKFEQQQRQVFKKRESLHLEKNRLMEKKCKLRKKYKDKIEDYHNNITYSDNDTNLNRILYTKNLKNWVFEAKPLTTMKNKEFLPQINKFVKEMKEKTGYFKQSKTVYDKRCSFVKNRLSELLNDEKRLKTLEEYYEYNKNYVPNIIRLLKYADSKIQKYFERIETDKRIEERSRIDDEKTNNWSSEYCWAKNEETYRKKRGGYLTWTDECGNVYDYTPDLFNKKCLGDKMNKMNKNFCRCCYNREQTIRKRHIIPNLLIGNHIRVSGFNKNISPNPIVFDKFGVNSFAKDESFMEEWDDVFAKEVMKQMDIVESKINA